MQHIHVVLGAFHQPFVENIEILESDVVLFIEETLSLHACHVEKIKLCDDVFQFDALFIGITALLKKVCDVVGNPELRRRDEDKVDVLIAGQCFDKGMDRSAELEISADTDRKVVETALELADRHHIEQGLGGMLMASVAGIDDRDS